MPSQQRLSAAAARRVALDAQGFGRPRPTAVGTRQLTAAIARLGLLQLDSVNVFERSHYLPLFARLGSYDRAVLDTMLHHDRPRRGLGRYTEYWAHEAAVIPVADWPLWGWRRDRFHDVRGRREWLESRAHIVDDVRAQLADGRPRKVAEIDHVENVSRGGGWWNKNDVHWAVQLMFGAGELVAVGRTRFERRYALAEQVIPAKLQEAVPSDEAKLELSRRALTALGIATVDDVHDYWRLPYLVDAQRAMQALVDSGEAIPVDVEGWDRPAFLRTGQRVPRRVEATALLSPFDPVVWHRPRAKRMFGFHYRISIYTPKESREHGYYVLPVLVDDELVGRIDLKSDRRAGVLRIQHAHAEPSSHGREREFAARIVPQLRDAAAWQGLERVQVQGPGTWATTLDDVLRAAP